MNKNVVITILVLVILALAGYLFYDKLSPKDNNENSIEETEQKENADDKESIDNKVSYTYSNVSGKYTYTSDVLDVLEGTNLVGRGILSLYENGTFIYHVRLMADGGYMGNYTIVDDKIVLNYLFELTNGAGVNVKEGSKILKINNDGTITDSNIKFGNFELNDIKLEKSDEQLDDEFSKIINNYSLSNNAV